jgi:hypothetical protein
VLLTAQVAASLIFLVLGGVFTRSLLAEARADPGFRTSDAATVTLEIASAGYGREGLPDFIQRFRARAAQSPALEIVAFTSRVPMGTVTSSAEVVSPGQVGGDGERAESIDLFTVGPEYLDAMRIAIVAGRGITEYDRPGSPAVAVVSRSFAARFDDAGGAVGQRITIDGADTEIVGVAEEVNVVRPREETTPHVYTALAQGGAFLLSIVGTTTGTSGEALNALRATLEEVDPTVVVWSAATIEDHVALKLLGPRIASRLLIGAAGIALLLTIVGVFGSVSYSAARRSREMAIRLSLGASSGAVTQLVISSMLRAITVGAIIGLALSALGTRLLQGMLFGVGPFDVWTYALAVAALGSTAALAAYLPARGAGRKNLTALLKED